MPNLDHKSFIDNEQLYHTQISGVTVGVSPVTHLSIYPSCPTSLLEDLQLSHQQAPMKYWPIDGGELGRPVENNYDLSVTGHKDGSLQFWDVSGE